MSILVRVVFRVNVNRVYSCKDKQNYSRYVEYMRFHSSDAEHIDEYLTTYGWAKYGLTQEHYHGCRACDPVEDVDPQFCGFRVEQWEIVPVRNSVTVWDGRCIAEFETEREKLWDQYMHKQSRKRLRMDELEQDYKRRCIEMKMEHEKAMSELKTDHGI